jgi:signal transduction histidine kinase
VRLALLDAGGAVLAGAVPARGRQTRLPVAGGTLIGHGRWRAPRRAALTPFVPMAEVLLAERARLARDLHDTVVQALYGIGLEAGSPAASLPWIRATAAAGLADLRGIMVRLRPETLAGAGIAAALRSVVETPGRPGWSLLVEADPPVSPRAEESVCRIALEALGNAARHARASRVTVRLAGDAGQVVLEVADDGVGFDPGGVFPGRLGLHSMRERAALLGGTVEIRTAPGAGTVVRAVVPGG